jgi:hypothetical protein
MASDVVDGVDGVNALTPITGAAPSPCQRVDTNGGSARVRPTPAGHRGSRRSTPRRARGVRARVASASAPSGRARAATRHARTAPSDRAVPARSTRVLGSMTDRSPQGRTYARSSSRHPQGPSWNAAAIISPSSPETEASSTGEINDRIAATISSGVIVRSWSTCDRSHSRCASGSFARGTRRRCRPPSPRSSPRSDAT